jgi:DNA topoisomerase-1
MAKKTTSKPADEGQQAEGKPRGRGSGRRTSGVGYVAGSARGKHLVIVESPSKARTINKYLGPEYVVLASVGHVRDLPDRNPKGDKSPVPGVDLKNRFQPTYQVLPGKEKVVADLKRAAKDVLSTGGDVWFATDLDREGEAIAWHLAQELGIDPSRAKRVIFPAITRTEIEKAFRNPHPIDLDRVNAQQARRILDRIVGYQVSPLLWKKVARGLSAGRVQSVAVRLIVEREREIRAFVPGEFWTVRGVFTPDAASALSLSRRWADFVARRDEKGNAPTLKAQGQWLAEHGAFSAELVEVGGEKFDLSAPAPKEGEPEDLSGRIRRIAELAGLKDVSVSVREDPEGKGAARYVRTVTGRVDPSTPYRVSSVETKQTTVRPPAPFITSTLQQAASSRLGFGAQRTMRAAQQLYEGVVIPGEGPVGLITYMRTDSTHLSDEAVRMGREFIARQFGERYLPERANVYASSNKAAQEAHEAIRPTDVSYTPAKVRRALTEDQHRLYTLIWERFVACQMSPAEWDSTVVTITGGTDPGTPMTFRATGRRLAFDGFYRVAGVPGSDEVQTLPAVSEGAAVAPVGIEPQQRFTTPPPRYTEASLIKTLEAEGIGRPSTYASIISVIQERGYVEQIQRRFHATDLGEVVTDKLLEAFDDIIDVGYTREMEAELDKVEEDHLDWVEMLRRFYVPFSKDLARAEKLMQHAKAETRPAPPEYTCPECEKAGRGPTPLVYRFGKNGRFLSCSRYPACRYATPVDREGRPRPAGVTVNVACVKCGGPMTRRTGRFGEFLGCARYGDKENPCDGILNIDRRGKVTAPSPPPLVTDLKCPVCESPLNLRSGVRGPWLGCSRFPKCRGRGKWAELPESQRAALEKALAEHARANPVPIVRTLDGRPLTDSQGRPLPSAPTIAALSGETPEAETLESVAEELGV